MRPRLQLLALALAIAAAEAWDERPKIIHILVDAFLDDEGKMNRDLMPDGLHPNEDGCREVSRNSITTECIDFQCVGILEPGPVSDRVPRFRTVGLRQWT